MTAHTYDYLIIGAGIMGLSVALELTKRNPLAHIAVLEKEPEPGLHASGRNSGVLHCGIYYASDTLKAKLCAKGAALMRAFAEEHCIPCERNGKIIIPTSAQDLPTVERLLSNAADHGIRAEKLDVQAVKALEPYANPYQVGIHCPDTAVIDGKGVIQQLRRMLEAQGVRFFWNCKIVEVVPAAKCVKSATDSFSYGYLLNCAGAHADRLAKMFGLAQNHALVPFKGIYYKLSPRSAGLVKNSIYPVPDIALPFLGVHLTRVISGDVYVGPTAIPALGRENYGLLQGIEWAESLTIAQRLAQLYWDNSQNFRLLAHSEMKKYLKTYFLDAARKLVPALKAEDLLPTQKSGIRPQLVNIAEQRLEMDYLLEHTENSLHVLNAISPAFTCGFAFAELLVDRMP
ncbi:MAG: L-2-hydroxyglutarate oxidase [Methylococcaceae bacterium]|nr:MAG: L-2-hydroxyglutarate oxidase [Methylococcaceae bacterium]